MTRSLEYTLPPLSRPDSQIRLLYLHDGNEDDEIHVDVTVHDLDQAPEYNAISYTWGSVDDGEETVFIDGEPIQVWKNCHYALWQARIHHPNEYVWIDAICINQADDTEKSAQVANMGRIFASATLMMASIGPHADDSEWLVPYGFDDFDKWEQMSNEQHMDWIRAKGEELVPRVSDACAALCQRPYWNRLWVVQEVAVSARKVILCGDSCMAWNTIDLRDRRMDVKKFEWTEEDALMGYGQTLSGNMIEPPATAMAHPASGSLDYIVAWFGEHQCSDPRDHFYGLLALVQWPEGVSPLQPDYTLTTLQLAVTVMSYIPFDLVLIVVAILELSLDDPALHSAVLRRRAQNSSTRDLSQSSSLVSADVQLSNVKLVSLKGIGGGCLDCSAFGRPADNGCRCCKDRHMRQDLRAKRELLLEMEDVSKWPKARLPHLLFNGSQPIGLLCHDARPGDLLMPFNSQLPTMDQSHRQNGLVIRHVWEDSFAIIGQAVLIVPSDPHLTLHGLDDSHFEADVCSSLSAEDWIVLAAQDLTVDRETLPEASLERLLTGVIDSSVHGPAVVEFRNVREISGSRLNPIVEQVGSMAEALRTNLQDDFQDNACDPLQQLKDDLKELGDTMPSLPFVISREDRTIIHRP
ncbi:hypothetical protein PRZ48_006695 [Zasmidium cellare]|uniref:Heterokaryon incompatibility domain-containing protein n=1 Tax=Zasmidium cellare TaxID=395010 RepID=A0ABR0ENT7_ZASCE|nr:hypothetical protein PRZ48_006695 [Zasmidium cellare]